MVGPTAATTGGGGVGAGAGRGAGNVEPRARVVRDPTVDDGCGGPVVAVVLLDVVVVPTVDSVDELVGAEAPRPCRAADGAPALQAPVNKTAAAAAATTRVDGCERTGAIREPRFKRS